MTIARHRQPDMHTAASWAFTLMLIGYPVAGLIGSAFNWDSALASIPFRLGVLTLSAVLLWTRRRLVRACVRNSPWLIAFTLIYLLRLLWDAGVASIPGASEALVFYTITVLLPGAALILVAGQLREDHAAQTIALMGGLVCAMAVTMYVMDWGIDRSLAEQTRRLSFEAVNPITLGHTAVTTIIASLTLARRRIHGVRLLLVPCLVGISLVCLVLAASRGPLLTLGVCGLVFGLSIGAARMKILALSIGLLTIAAAIVAMGDDSPLLMRFSNLEEDDSSLQRLLLQSNAITQFLGKPLLGSAFTELEFLEYPHNLFIETAMALGVVGLLTMTILIFQAGTQFVRRLRVGETLTPLLLLQYFLAIQFSGSLWGAASFWALMAVTLGDKIHNKPRRLRRSIFLAKQRPVRVSGSL